MSDQPKRPPKSKSRRKPKPAQPTPKAGPRVEAIDVAEPAKPAPEGKPQPAAPPDSSPPAPAADAPVAPDDDDGTAAGNADENVEEVPPWLMRVRQKRLADLAAQGKVDEAEALLDRIKHSKVVAKPGSHQPASTGPAAGQEPDPPPRAKEVWHVDRRPPPWLSELERVTQDARNTGEHDPALAAAMAAAHRSEVADTLIEAPTADPPPAASEAESLRQRRARRRRVRQTQVRQTNTPLAAIRSGLIMLLAAFLIATIFTFWTPADFLSDETREGLAQAYATQNVIINPPTSVPTPIWMRRVGIVAGHRGPHPSTGLDDPGAVCDDGLTENEINFNIASLIVQELSGLGYNVDLLDEWDPRLSGYEASALLSIHADSCIDFELPGATGYKVAPPAARNTVRPDDEQLVNCLIRHYGDATGLPLHPSITRDMTEYHSFREIASITPSAIIEVGFMFEDRDLLENNPELAAQGIVAGLLCFLEDAPPTPMPELTPWPTIIATPTPLDSPPPS